MPTNPQPTEQKAVEPCPQVIRQDSYGRSGPRSSSTSHFPLGRWVSDFENERGNTIHVEVTNRHHDAVQIRIDGPATKCTNTVTPMEAQAIYTALGCALEAARPLDTPILEGVMRSAVISSTEHRYDLVDTRVSALVEAATEARHSLHAIRIGHRVDLTASVERLDAALASFNEGGGS